jgi:hypothetical protein
MAYHVMPSPARSGLGWIGLVTTAIQVGAAAGTAVATQRMQTIDNQRARSKQEDLAKAEGAAARKLEMELAQVQARVQERAIDRSAGIGPDAQAGIGSGHLVIGAVILAAVIGAVIIIRRGRTNEKA